MTVPMDLACLHFGSLGNVLNYWVLIAWHGAPAELGIHEGIHAMPLDCRLPVIFNCKLQGAKFR